MAIKLSEFIFNLYDSYKNISGWHFYIAAQKHFRLFDVVEFKNAFRVKEASLPQNFHFTLIPPPVSPSLYRHRLF